MWHLYQKLEQGHFHLAADVIPATLTCHLAEAYFGLQLVVSYGLPLLAFREPYAPLGWMVSPSMLGMPVHSLLWN